MISVSFPILNPVPEPGALEVSLAAIEYTLANSIAIRDATDIKSLKHWSERLEPFEHQVQNLITFCRRAPVALLADDVGMGKTISAGLIVSELMVRKKVKRVLVLAPKILLPQWVDELQNKFGIAASNGTGSDASRLARSNIPVVVTTYASSLNRMEEFGQAGFDMLILDEAHKVRNLYGTPQPPRIATALRQAMATGVYRYSLLLTATPIHNRLWDIYSLIDILSAGRNHQNPLGSEGEFAARYLADRKNSARRLKPGRIPEFRRIVSDYMVRTSRADSGLTFPEREVKSQRCEPGAVERQMEQLVREEMPKLGRLQQLSLAEALMSSPSALATQVRNAASRKQVGERTAKAAEEIADLAPLGCKALPLLDLARRLREERPADWRMVVFTRRKATQRAIGEVLEVLGARVGFIGGGHARTQDETVRGFQADPPSVNVIVSTDAGAEGVNLQAGNVVVNYDLPWNPMTVEQRIGRVQRLASKHASVVVTNLVVKGSVEELVVARLMEKLQLISAAIGDVEGILEVAGSDDSLEEDIRDLVLKALTGQDVEDSLRRIEESIDRARHLYNESKELVSENLGDLRGMHSVGPAAPEVKDVVPRLSVREIVSRFYQGSGQVVDRPEGRLWIKQESGASHLATFDPSDPMLSKRTGHFGGRMARLYAEGEPEFERIIGASARQRLHHVEQAFLDEVDVKKAVLQWIEEHMPLVQYISHRTKALSPRFQGSISALVTCSVSVDRLERIVEAHSDEPGWRDVDHREGGRVKLPRSDQVMDEGSWPQAVGVKLSAAIAADSSVRAFQEFYMERMGEELEKAAGNPNLMEQVRRRFEPNTSAEVVSAQGRLCHDVEVETTFQYREGPASTLMLVVDGFSGMPISGPQTEVCAISGVTAPSADLEECAISGRRALRHLMVTSSVSGVHMFPEHSVKCEVSGKFLLPSEAVRSSFSSRSLSPEHAVMCAVTQRHAASDEVGECEFTRAKVHASHIRVSEVSGKRYRADQDARSQISGVTGHVSEFSTCEASGSITLPSELRTSDVSGKRVRQDWLVASDKNPGRFGIRTEVVRCQVTDRSLLADEVGKSSVSGLIVDSDLLEESALSGAKALPQEMFQCEASRSLVLPDETVTCESTGKRVREDLAARSDISGRMIMKSLLVRCPETGDRGAAEELATCQITGLTVSPGALERCTATGKHVVRRLLVECVHCGDRLLRTEAVRTKSGHLAHPDHVIASAFSRDSYLDSELATCSASGLRVEPEELKGVYSAPLIDVAVAWLGKQPSDTSSIPLISELLAPKQIRVRAVWSRPTPNPSMDAVLVEGPRRLLAQPNRYAFFVNRESRRIVGSISKVSNESGTPRFSPW